MKRQIHSFLYWSAIVPVFVAMMAGHSAAAQSQMPCRYEVAHIISAPPLPPPAGSPVTTGVGISPNGRYVCGRFFHPPGDDRPFIYDTMTQQFIAPTMPANFYAGLFEDINDNAMAVGTGWKNNIGQRGFVFNLTTNQWTELEPLPGGLWSSATGINSGNVVCGVRSIGPGVDPQTAFRWSVDKGFEDLGLINGLSSGGSRINDDNVLLGWIGNSVFSPNTRVVIDYGKETVVLDPIPHGINSVPNEINNKGQVLLGGQLTKGGTAAYLFDEGVMQALPPLPGFDATSASILDEAGIVMGRSRTVPSPPTYRPTYWIDGVPHDLLALYPTDPSLTIDGPAACSALGQLIVNSTFSSKVYFLAPVHRSTGDTNCDQVVNETDLLNVVTSWGQCEQCDADLNSDGLVSVADLLIVIFNWSS